MKSIFTVSCFVVMALVIETKVWKIPPVKIIRLIEDMNAICNSLKNGSCGCHSVYEIDFTSVNCTKEAYQETFCQVNHTLHSCKNCNVPSVLSDFHNGKCTLNESSRIPLKDFCSEMLTFLEKFYRICA